MTAAKTPAKKSAPAKKGPAPESTEVTDQEIDALLDVAPEAPDVPEGGFALPDPEDPYAGMSRDELVKEIETAKGKSRFEPPERRATLMFAPRGNSRFYLNGRSAGSWDQNEPEAHVWRQIETKCRATGEDEVDVVHWPHRILPDLLPPPEELGVRASPALADVVKRGPRKPAPGNNPTTSYQTGAGLRTESL